ncbi:enhanced serine sensitivity protein SseB C-terminal domain-containing protein [Hymenobacter lucidus]|uniref:Enhanced serine sensitivity protein SseB C-terminal domain-containing protein n=1 Tax=Hymenobacter lucidus TaxID=2880930 RepID=A0ABS8AYP5_9BACT|nr:enhanced serine sensitivity protein SseB C-terminal domain-containing protein [Hymenobacter lucidus]MCB2410927.1 enhanced serine sensitivity protein SseB C-terminal domain-containing protein [Hymenobacter lucidus]
MGLFDFLKSNKPAPQTPAPTTPPASSEGAAPATPATSGPRYKGASYTSPTAAPAPVPQMPPMPQLPIPELPSMPHFEPLNVLEQLLFNAATMPEFRPGFYQALLNEEVFVVTIPKEGEPTGEVTPVEGMEIQLQVLNDGKIPVFTSKERVFEGETEENSLPFMRLRGLDFFQMTQGADCALNPFSSIGKLLPATEIAELLSSNLAQPAPGNVQVMLGPPTEEHTPLIEAVRGFALSKPQVEVAHVAMVHFQDNTSPSRLLLAFYTDDNDPAFLEEMGPVIQGNIKDNDLVDVMVLDKTSEEPLNQYFLQAEPVYKRDEA